MAEQGSVGWCWMVPALMEVEAGVEVEVDCPQAVPGTRGPSAQVELAGTVHWHLAWTGPRPCQATKAQMEGAEGVGVGVVVVVGVMCLQGVDHALVRGWRRART